MSINVLKKLGFSDKSATVYLTLLRLGPSSVRSLAEACELNRGTTYDTLNWLKERGVVDFFHKDQKQQYIAKDPDTLKHLVRFEEAELRQADRDLDRVIPELQALYNSGGSRPVARYYEKGEIAQILNDVLATCEVHSEPMYRMYSTEGIREYLYEQFPTFSDVRVAKGIRVRVIALGAGGELRGLDERKWIKKQTITPTSIIVYPGKTAYISLNAKKEPVGVVIENDGVYETQKMVFDELWEKL